MMVVATAPAQQQAGSWRLALILLYATVAWNAAEGVIAITAAFMAGSVALMGFGLDSVIEVTAASVLIWRLRAPEGDEGASAREHRAHQLVGLTFLALAAYIGIQAIYTIVAGSSPEASTVGVALAAASLTVMPALGLVKRANARRLGSPALIAESSETLVCSYLSFALLLGLGANAAFGWWWADIAAALAMVPWIVKEGLEGVRGEGCEESCT